MLLLLFLIVHTLSSSCTPETETPLECYARTGYLTPDYSYRLWDISSVSQSYLDTIWTNYTDDVATEEMRKGVFDGVVLYLYFSTLGKAAFKTLVGNWTTIFDDSLESELSCFQKHFYAEDDSYGRSGINYWCSSHATKLPMKIYVSQAFGDYGFNSLKIDYDVTGNLPAIETPFIDEIRLIAGTPDLYLGKMYFRVVTTPVFVLWFALHKR